MKLHIYPLKQKETKLVHEIMTMKRKLLINVFLGLLLNMATEMTVSLAGKVSVNLFAPKGTHENRSVPVLFVLVFLHSF